MRRESGCPYIILADIVSDTMEEDYGTTFYC